MATDFEERIDRRHSNSLKWAYARDMLGPEHAAIDPLPMWVADMDFRAPAAVTRALHEMTDFGVFGYAGITDAYREAVTGWQARRFGWQASGDWLVHTPGVVTALNLIIQTFSAPGDSVLVQRPVYVHFHQDVAANGRRVVNAPLTLENGRYHFDPERFEAAIAPDTRLFILCNPQNPTGNVWSREDLTAMGEICLRHGVLVISDEVHEDLIMDDSKRHTPFAALGGEFADNCFICTAPSKTFNLAGLQCSNIFVPNPRLRAEFVRHKERCGVNLINLAGLTACEAAYRHGEPWLEEVLAHIRGNQKHFAAAVNGKLAGLTVLPADSLYLAWMDCRALGLSAEDLNTFMLTRARLWLDRGEKYGPEGHGFMRVNLACPRRVVDEAIDRLRLALA